MNRRELIVGAGATAVAAALPAVPAPTVIEVDEVIVWSFDHVWTAVLTVYPDRTVSIKWLDLPEGSS